VCPRVPCHPGRECVLVGAVPQCVCVSVCPDHWKPVCGSDGVSYDNHCSLHKTACDTNVHITPLHQGFCSGQTEDEIAREQFIAQLSMLEEPSGNKIQIPDACFQNDRNRLREFLMSWFTLSAKRQHWYIPGMSRGEELWEHFYLADLDRNQGLDTREWLEYLNRNKTNRDIKEQNRDQMRRLCLVALVEEGDTNRNEKLEWGEFRTIMGDQYTPSSKVCYTSDSNMKYSDGAERSVECNMCVCACGKWVCTSEMCVEGYRDVETGDTTEEEVGDILEDDWDDGEEDPEDDPDVQDIRWF